MLYDAIRLTDPDGDLSTWVLCVLFALAWFALAASVSLLIGQMIRRGKGR